MKDLSSFRRSWTGNGVRIEDEVFLVSGSELFKLRGNLSFNCELVTVTGSQLFDSIYVEEYKAIEFNECVGNQLLIRSKNSSIRKPSVVNIDKLCSLCASGGVVGLVDNMSTISFSNFYNTSRKYNLKAIYGCELNVFFDNYDPFYLCSETIKNQPLNKLKFLCLDLETNGIDAFNSDIIEVGYVLIDELVEVDDFSALVQTRKHATLQSTNGNLLALR